MYICIFIAINNNVWFLNFSPINILYSTDFHLTKSCRHRFSLQTSKNIINHQIDHFQSGFSCGSSNMWGQNHIWHLDQFMIWSNGFRSHDIKSSTTNFSFLLYRYGSNDGFRYPKPWVSQAPQKCQKLPKLLHMQINPDK